MTLRWQGDTPVMAGQSSRKRGEPRNDVNGQLCQTQGSLPLDFSLCETVNIFTAGAIACQVFYYLQKRMAGAHRGEEAEHAQGHQVDSRSPSSDCFLKSPTPCCNHSRPLPPAPFSISVFFPHGFCLSISFLNPVFCSQLPTLTLSRMTVQADLNARSSAWHHRPLPDWVYPACLLTAPTPVMITLLG